MRNTICTYTNTYIDPFNPDPDLINIEDIAHSLSLQCRFNGHSNYMYSVARHSIHVCSQLRREGWNVRHQLAGLMHDASEAYLCDIPSPIKHREEFAFYREVEDKMMKVIFDKFELDYPLSEAVEKADKDQTMAEVHVGRYSFNTNPQEDETDFLNLFNSLASGSKNVYVKTSRDPVFAPKF